MNFWNQKDTYKYMHIKRDGMNICLWKQKCVTRIGHSIDLGWLINLRKFWSKYRCAYAELWYPGKPASHIKTALKARDPKLRLDFYAIEDFSANTTLEELKMRCRNIGVQFIPFYLWDLSILERELPPDVEGYVFKNGNMGPCCKWKPHYDCDLVIKGFLPGQGKYENTLGALIVGTFDGSFQTKVSGMTDDIRNYLWEKQDEVLNRVVEIRHNGILSRGGFRHPRFIRFRDDKPAEECNSVSPVQKIR